MLGTTWFVWVGIALLGVLALLAPSIVIAADQRLQTPPALFLSAVLRLVMGVVFYLAAPPSRAPDVVRSLGIAVILASVITAGLALPRFHHWTDWWAERRAPLIRPFGAVAFVLGCLLIYVFAR